MTKAPNKITPADGGWRPLFDLWRSGPPSLISVIEQGKHL
jgi:hypothetical protein